MNAFHIQRQMVLFSFSFNLLFCIHTTNSHTHVLYMSDLYLDYSLPTCGRHIGYIYCNLKPKPKNFFFTFAIINQQQQQQWQPEVVVQLATRNYNSKHELNGRNECIYVYISVPAMKIKKKMLPLRIAHISALQIISIETISRHKS